MRIYAVASGNASDVLQQLDYPWVLIAFGAGDPFALPYRPGLLLDSGAFSAWTIGKAVDVDEYAAWALDVVDRWPSEVRVLNLDVIPGDPDRPPTQMEREASADESRQNADRLREHGLDVIEVWHLHEPLGVLGDMLDRRRPGELVALGGMVFALARRTNLALAFCDTAFAFIRDRYGWRDMPPIHGLGVSGDSFTAKRYPWFSVDSIAWLARNPNLEVDSSGRFRHRGSVGRPRTDAASALYAARRLGLWERTERSLTEMWTRRGVSYAS